MTASVEGLSRDRSRISIDCGGCSRSAVTDAFSREVFLEMIGWHTAGEAAWCSCCQLERGMTPRFGSSSGRLRHAPAR